MVVTQFGQFLLIIIALIGIPLNLLFLLNVGNSFAEWIRIAYDRGCCYLCKRRRRKEAHEENELLKEKNIMFIFQLH